MCSCILPDFAEFGLNCVKDFIAGPHVLKQVGGPQHIQHLVFILRVVQLGKERLDGFLD